MLSRCRSLVFPEVAKLSQEVGESLMTLRELTSLETKYEHMCTHTEIQSDTSQGSIIMTGVKPRFPLVSLVSVATCLCVCLWKTDV